MRFTKPYTMPNAGMMDGTVKKTGRHNRKRQASKIRRRRLKAAP